MKNTILLIVALVTMSLSTFALQIDPPKESLKDNLIVDIQKDSSRNFVLDPQKDDHAVTVLNFSDLKLRFLYNGKVNLPDSEGMEPVDLFHLEFEGYTWVPQEPLANYDLRYFQFWAANRLTILSVAQLKQNEHKLPTLTFLGDVFGDQPIDDNCLVIVDNSSLPFRGVELKTITVKVFKVDHDTKTLVEIDHGQFSDDRE